MRALNCEGTSHQCIYPLVIGIYQNSIDPLLLHAGLRGEILEVSRVADTLSDDEKRAF